MSDVIPNFPSRHRIFAQCLILACLGIAGCATFGEQSPASTSRVESKPRSLTLKGVEALRENRLREASRLFNGALKLDIRNSYLQYLNAMTYHLLAVRSDRSQFPLAEQGYNLAIRFDPTNWLARYQLGLLYLDRRQYERAKNAFANALLYEDSDPDVLYNFAVSAYYARDPQSAAGALARLHDLERDSPRSLRASAIVMAALGNNRQADGFLQDYRRIADDTAQEKHLARRVRQWQHVHARARELALREPNRPSGRSGAVRPAQSQSTAQTYGTPASDMPYPATDLPPQAQTEGRPGDSDQPARQGPDLDPANRMVIVDVVIVASREDISTAKGVNLLNGLTIQFGGANGAPAFSSEFRDVSGDAIDGPRVNQTTITRALTIPSITYSLNIANAGATRNEILARPTLVALAGQRSEFFSGENVRAASVSTTAQQGSTTVEKDIGVKLAVTPDFTDSGQVRLLVEAERTFLQTPSSSVQYDFQIRTTKTTVNANVLMNFGESLILSGLSEKETENIRDGVPGLQDVPVIQYLFSRETTRDFNKSVLVLLTPRRPEYVYRQQDDGQSRPTGDGNSLNELKARYSDWFRPYPNWASIFRHLQGNSLYREFRTGDVSLERWDTQMGHGARLNKALDFLYY